MEQKLARWKAGEMTRAYILVEGQTEEAFTRELLSPHYARIGLYLTAIIVRTKPGYKGGVVNYAKIKPQIERLCKQDTTAHVSTMFDLYGLPGDFPGRQTAGYPANGSGAQKAEFLEAAWSEDVAQSNFIPNLMAHEFEALLFAQPDQFARWEGGPQAAKALTAIREKFPPEEINDTPGQAPSKRIMQAMPAYQKTVHGPLIAIDIGLDAMRAACPHFAAWLKKLEGLAPPA